MGLAMPGRGVQAPTLGFELDSFQEQALDELGQNTVSPFNAGNAAAPGRINPSESGRISPREAGGSAFTPVPVVGINPPPHLPGHEFLLSGVTAGVNLGIRLTNATTSRQRSLIAAGGIGDRVVFPVGTHTRNPDQVDVLHLMNQQMAQARIAHLSSMMPSQDERRMAHQLESAIVSALQHMAQYKAVGMDTSAMSCRITALENELNGKIDSMFKL